MIDPEEIKSRYTKTEMAEDAMGRIITVGRIKPSQQAKIADLAGENTGNLFSLVACVRRIDDDHIPFPKNRGELEAVMDRLDQEGLDAAGQALAKLAGIVSGAPADGVEAAKNS